MAGGYRLHWFTIHKNCLLNGLILAKRSNEKMKHKIPGEKNIVHLSRLSFQQTQLNTKFESSYLH